MTSDEGHRELLEHEDLINEILRKRTPQKRAHWWESAALISSLTAVLTVLVTSVASYITQRAVRSQEFVLSQTDARARQTRDAITEIYELLSETLRISDERISLASGEYDNLTDQQLRELIDNVNKVDARWLHERETSEVLVYLYFQGSPSALEAWRSAKATMQTLMECAERTYLSHQGSKGSSDACNSERKLAGSGLEEMREAFIKGYNSLSRP